MGILKKKPLCFLVPIIISVGLLFGIFFWNPGHDPKNLFTDSEIETIEDFKSKCGTFPDPDDQLTTDVARILLKPYIDRGTIDDMLGSPDGIAETKADGDARTVYSYDVSDSRMIQFVFDGEGHLLEIVGTGVGFKRLRP